MYVHFEIFYARNNNLTPRYAFQQRLCVSNYVLRKRVSIATNINVRWYLLSPLGPLHLLSSTLHSQITHSTRSMTRSDPRLPHTYHTYRLIRFENVLPMNVLVFSTTKPACCLVKAKQYCLVERYRFFRRELSSTGSLYQDIYVNVGVQCVAESKAKRTQRSGSRAYNAST